MSKSKKFYDLGLNPITMKRESKPYNSSIIDLTAKPHPVFSNRYKNMQI